MKSNITTRILFSKLSYPALIAKFILLLVFFVGTSTVSQAQNCPPPDPNCTPTQTFTATVTIPDYPNCSLTVRYDLRICNGEFQISNISFTLDIFNCSPLISDVLDVFFSANADALTQERFLARLTEQVETALADQLFAAAVAGGPAILYDCEVGLTTFTAAFYRGSCVSFCVTRDDNGAIGFVPLTCGTTCCVKRSEYCLDSNGNTVVTTTTSQVVPGECFTFPRPECPAGSLFQSPCFELCETE